MLYTVESLRTMYCEDYDDQDGTDFSVLSCSVPGHEVVIEPINNNLAAQVVELRRKYGHKATISLYKEV